MSHRDPVEFYARHGLTFDKQRPRSLYEVKWLDDMLVPHANGATVLDAGCGAGDPIAKYIAYRGYAVTGLDTTEAMLELAQDCGASVVYWNRLYDPATLARDRQAKTALRANGLEVEFRKYFFGCATGVLGRKPE